MNYSDTLKTGRMQLMSDLVAGKTFTASGGAASAGKLVIGTALLSGAIGVLVTVPLPTTPFVVSGSGTVAATLQGVPLSANAVANGTAAKAELRNNSDVTVVSGLSVGTINTDIVLASISINNGQLVTVTSGVITHA